MRRLFSCGLSHDAHFPDQLDARLREHLGLHVVDDALDVAAVAPPTLTMKFACLVETCAPPIVKPLRPIDSMRPRGVVARRVAEDAARVGLVERLRGHALARAARACAPWRGLVAALEANTPETNHSSRRRAARTCR
jgi:hypothetical protein